MQTTFEFMLPRGYVDENGEVHRSGTMRLATAADEILPLRDPRVQQNGGYLSIILLSRVITKLGLRWTSPISRTFTRGSTWPTRRFIRRSVPNAARRLSCRWIF